MTEEDLTAQLEAEAQARFDRISQQHDDEARAKREADKLAEVDRLQKTRRHDDKSRRAEQAKAGVKIKKPNAPPPPAPAATDGGYTIKSGDTLSAIAARNNTTVDELVRLNGIKDRDSIQAGAKLRLKPAPEPEPKPAAPQAPAQPERNHVREKIQEQRDRGPKTLPQIAGELREGFHRNPDNTRTAETAGAYAGAVAGGPPVLKAIRGGLDKWRAGQRAKQTAEAEFRRRKERTMDEGMPR